jgi:hypothetical protein
LAGIFNHNAVVRRTSMAEAILVNNYNGPAADLRAAIESRFAR